MAEVKSSSMIIEVTDNINYPKAVTPKKTHAQESTDFERLLDQNVPPQLRMTSSNVHSTSNMLTSMFATLKHDESIGFITSQGSGSGSESDNHNDNESLTFSSPHTKKLTPSDDYVEDDSKKRLIRNRERNREHARRTRLRKKIHMEAMQSKVKDLSKERENLMQRLEECNIASILLCLGSNDSESEHFESCVEMELSDSEKHVRAALLSGNSKRCKNILSLLGSQETNVQTMLEGNPTDPDSCGIENKSRVDWKTGVYHHPSGKQNFLSADQLEALRRERNRMHAKMTRDRKKCFTSVIEKTIRDLEEENERIKAVLNKVRVMSDNQTKLLEEEITSSSMVTPIVTPKLVPDSPNGKENYNNIEYGNEISESSDASPQEKGTS